MIDPTTTRRDRRTRAEQYVICALRYWADWTLAGGDEGDGWPAASVEARMMDGIPGAAAAGSRPPTYARNGEERRIEMALADMPEAWARALRTHYLQRGLEADRKADELRMSLTRYYEHVLRGHAWIMGRWGMG